MRHKNRRLLMKLVPALLAVAIAGYLAGGGFSQPASSSVPSGSLQRTLGASNTIVLNYPGSYGWRPAASAPRVPGLSLTHTFLLAPTSGDARVGLIAGQTGSGQTSPTSPLPQALLAAFDRPLEAEIVNLSDIQAYRYSGLNSKSPQRRFTIYAIPYVGGPTTVIVCYAPSEASFSRYLHVCEQIAAQLTLQVEAQSQSALTPNVDYAQQLSAIVMRLDRLRMSLRVGMSLQAKRATLSGLARRLAAGVADAARSLSALQPPAAASSLATALFRAVSQAHDAYLELASAVDASSPSRYAAARSRVYRAEAAFSAALKGFALIGYE